MKEQEHVAGQEVGGSGRGHRRDKWCWENKIKPVKNKIKKRKNKITRACQLETGEISQGTYKQWTFDPIQIFLNIYFCARHC